MYFFLLLALPLAFLLLVLLSYPTEELGDARRAVLKGLLFALPLWLLSRLAGSLVEPAWGSPLLLFHEWADRLLPYSALPALGYALFYRYGERLGSGRLERRLAAFYAGSLGPVGLAEMLRLWGRPEPYDIFVLPLLLVALILALPCLVAIFFEEYGFRRLLLALGTGLATLLASILPWLFLARLWPLALLLALLLLGGAWLLAAPRLFARPNPLRRA